MPLDTTLLDLDRAPTIKEMRAFFKKHDWSAAKFSEPKSRTTEHHEAISRISRIMDEAFEKAAEGNATKIIIPSEIQGIAGLASSLTGIVEDKK